jgi:hypothetical protein
VPVYSSGYAAARADGWCVQCLNVQAIVGKSMCDGCKNKRDQRGKNRNARRPSTRRVRGDYQAVFDQVEALKVP